MYYDNDEEDRKELADLKKIFADYNIKAAIIFKECPYKVMIFDHEDYLKPRLDWIRENITGKWDTVNLGCDVLICFADLNDITIFKLIWGGDQKFEDVYDMPGYCR